MPGNRTYATHTMDRVWVEQRRSIPLNWSWKSEMQKGYPRVDPTIATQQTNTLDVEYFVNLTCEL